MHGELSKIWCVFWGAENNFRIHNRDFFFVNSEIVFCQKKNAPFFSKVRHVGSQVQQKLFKSARILSDKKIFGFLLGSACKKRYFVLWGSNHKQQLEKNSQRLVGRFFWNAISEAGWAGGPPGRRKKHHVGSCLNQRDRATCGFVRVLS